MRTPNGARDGRRPWAELLHLMQIRVTVGQFNAMRVLFGPELRYAYWLDQAVANAKQCRDVTMPAVAWVRVRDDLKQRCFNVYGKRSSKVPSIWGRLLTRVALNLAEREAHPALRGEGIAGRWGELMPVWETAEGLSPYPRLDAKFGVLTPEWVEVPGLLITVWRVKPPPPDVPILDERQHLAFGLVV